jgi:hypothetical protein
MKFVVISLLLIIAIVTLIVDILDRQSTKDVVTSMEMGFPIYSRETPFTSHISLTGRVFLLDNPKARDVSYQELLDFLREDQTDQLQYVKNEFSCSDFAETLQHNAEKKGIQCAWVYVNLMGATDHSINAFQTKDRGLIFVDDSGSNEDSHPSNMDKTVILEKGRDYCPESLFLEEGWAKQWGCTGVVEDYRIYWNGFLTW